LPRPPTLGAVSSLWLITHLLFRGAAAVTERPITVALVDDHALVRQGFRRLLEDNPRIKVVAEGGTGLEAIEIARRLKPDVIVLDMAMPELNGIEAAEKILRLSPQARIMILSMYSDEAYVRQAMRVGVKGYVLKDALDLDLANAVVSIAEGKPYLSPGVAQVLMEVVAEGRQSTSDDPYDRLTLREKEVLQMVAQGKSNKEIAQLLGISPNTVAVHRANLMETLGIHRTAELVLYAVKKGFVKPQ
jgi:DNA-binding NarL/FixJ family response regulator